MKDLPGPVSFRPSVKTWKRLDFVEKFGVSKSQAINDVLEAHLGEYARDVQIRNSKSLMEAIQSDVP